MSEHKTKEIEQSMVGDFPNQERLLKHISDQITLLANDDSRWALIRQGIGQTLARHTGIPVEPLPEMPLPSQQAPIFEVFSLYMALASLQHSLTEVEYYFRRYPFRGLPVGHSDHLRNICEMYFDRIEQFRQRLKLLTIALAKFTGKSDRRYGNLIKLYSKHFKWENKQRNLTHHNQRFDYDVISQLGLIELLTRSPEMKLLPNAGSIYRQEARKWVSRVRAHSLQLAQVVEVAAELVLEVLPSHDGVK
jgi:hypothetical protein